MSDVLRIENDGYVRILTLNRPEHLNALSSELAWGYVNAIREAARDDSVRVIGVTGAGRAFCAGADITGASRLPTDLSPLSPQDAYLDDVGWIGNLYLAARHECDKPVVAAINGSAAGGGLGIAMAADMRVAGESARLVSAYLRIGGSPDAGLSMTITQLLGHEGAMRFFLNTRPIDAQEALRLGLVGEVVPDDALQPRLRELCASIARWSPIATRFTKRCVVKAGTAVDPREVVRFERENVTRSFASNDAIEARKAFFEKREPVFTGT